LPTYIQGAMGRSPAAAGLALAASSVSWTFASIASGRLMIRTSYRLAAGIGGVCLVAGSLVLLMLEPTDSLLWAGTGALLNGIGMGFCNTAFIVSTQAAVGWNERGMATSSMMFMRMVGSSVGAAVFGAIVNFGIYRQLPEAGDAVNRRDCPADRSNRELGAHRLCDRCADRGRQSRPRLGIAGQAEPDTTAHAAALTAADGRAPARITSAPFSAIMNRPRIGRR
jgi:hypothetical protein